MRQIVYIYLVLIFAAALATQSDAKRGCSLYGHSCYGGHGKRSEVTDDFAQDKTIAYRQIPPQMPANDNRQIVSYLLPNDVRDLDAYQRYRLAKLMKQWMENQRSTEKLNDQENISNEFLKESTTF